MFHTTSVKGCQVRGLAAASSLARAYQYAVGAVAFGSSMTSNQQKDFQVSVLERVGARTQPTPLTKIVLPSYPHLG